MDGHVDTEKNLVNVYMLGRVNSGHDNASGLSLESSIVTRNII